ncbi:MAG: PHP domain-containing protein [Mycoplasmataceae bacterium]|nr:PHP domain-containing protein [Mycoplasmataceae bacterium]
MLIDLHLHSLHSRHNGDSIKWLGDKETLSLIYKKGYRAISFTDHSIFDSKQYIEMRLYLNGAISIFPGIEINIRTARGEIGNILYIFPQDLSKEQLLNLEKITIKYLRKEGISKEILDVIFNDYEFLKIPHVGKSDYLEYEDLIKYGFDAFEITNATHNNFKKVMKLHDKPVSVVAFSDTHVWTGFPQNDRLITEMDFREVPSFKDMKEYLKTNKDYTKEKYDKSNNI